MIDQRPKTHSLTLIPESIPEDQIIKNLSIKGWLKKKSPAVLKSWQKRYFMTIFGGSWKLVYFDNDKTDCKPNGAFDINTILNITAKDQKIFVIQFPSRELELRAKTNELQMKWIETLNLCKYHIPKQKRQISLDQTIKMVDESPKKEGHKQVDTMTAQLAQMEKEISRKDGSSDLTKKEIKQIEKKNIEQLSNDRLIDVVGLRDYISKMNEQFIQNRMIYGYLGKRSKGKVKYFQKRWFILVSAKSLFPTEYNDERILYENQLPPWLELDTLLYFKPSNEGKAPKAKGNIKMLECQDIIIKNMQKSKENGFTFKINMGDRLYHLTTETEGDRKRWQTALSVSIRTTKEINNPLKIVIKKNIDPLIQIYDNEVSLPLRREKIKSKLESDIQQLLQRQNLTPENMNSDFNNLFTMLTIMQRDMLESLQACVVKDPQRKDIIKEYIEIVHEKICDIITDYWDQTHQQFDSLNLLKLSHWLHDYQEILKAYFNDERILAGVRVLLGIFVNRSLESVETVIQGIIDYERKSEPFKNDQDLLITQSPVDLFKIINEGFDMAYNQCKSKETIYKMAHFGKQIIQQYQNGLDEIMEENIFQVDKCISTCNNTVALFEYTKNYQRRLKSLGSLTDEEIDKIFDTQKVTKQFVSISNQSREKFFFMKFRDVSKPFKKFYLELHIIDTLKLLIEPAVEPMSHLHDSFSRKVWKQLLDILVIFYFNCFIISCPKAKKEQFDEFIDKLESDKDTLTQEFEAFLFESQINSALKPFDDMILFLQSESVGILEPCRNLRIYFGRAFSEKTIKQILQLRFNMDKDKKKDTLEACRDLIEDYNRQNKDENVDQEKTHLLDVLGQEEEEAQDDQQKQDQKNQQQERRQDINLFDEEAFDPEEQQQHSIEEETKKDYIEEGFIYKKKPDNSIVKMKQLVKNWDYRYVRIRKGFMYWYINQKSREAQNKMDLSKIDDVIPHQTKATKFYIQLEGGKKYKFKALTKEERDLWIKTILREQNQFDSVQVQKIEAFKTGGGKKPLIKDYDEIARKERQRIKAEEKRKKRLEKEQEMKRKQSEQKVVKQQVQVQILGEKQENMGSKDPEPFETQSSNKNNVGCWTQFLIMIGVERPK